MQAKKEENLSDWFSQVWVCLTIGSPEIDILQGVKYIICIILILIGNFQVNIWCTCELKAV